MDDPWIAAGYPSSDPVSDIEKNQLGYSRVTAKVSKRLRKSIPKPSCSSSSSSSDDSSESDSNDCSRYNDSPPAATFKRYVEGNSILTVDEASISPMESKERCKYINIFKYHTLSNFWYRIWRMSIHLLLNTSKKIYNMKYSGYVDLNNNVKYVIWWIRRTITFLNVFAIYFLAKNYFVL